MRELTKKELCKTGIFATVLMLSLGLVGCGSKQAEEVLPPEPSPMQEQQGQQIEIPTSPEETVDVSIEVPGDTDEDKMVAMTVADTGRANPFVPSSEDRSSDSSARAPITEIPQETLKYDILTSSLDTEVDEAAKKVLTTKVSGIMYDKNSPSAILNIEGEDYLVRSGDVLNGYKVLSIGQSAVTVQYGNNVYRAGVGQLIAAGKDELHYNTVANLSGKFGGGKR